MTCISSEQTPKVHLLRERDDAKSYRIGKRSEPSSLTESNVNSEKDWLDERLDFNSAYCKAANHTTQSDLDYFPVTPYPPNESVLKDYLDFLLDLRSDLEIDKIFCHSNQDVFPHPFSES